MMKRLVSFLTVFHCFIFAFSQNELVANATAFIRIGKFDQADNYLDSILKIQPRNIDALMMKGNVRLNYEYVNQQDYFAINADLESVLDTTSINEQTGIKIIPVATARQVEKFWKECLEIDSSRTDIRKGLCSLYGMALMKEELKKEILELIRWDKNEDGDLAFKIGNYAREFKVRGDFTGAVELYKFISAQYPDLAGIRCDLAWEYFYDGRFKQALNYLDSALSKKNIDETTYLNAAFAYSELGYYDNAYKCLAGYSKAFNTKMDVFYKGLLLFADSSAGYTVVLNNFITTTDSQAYYDEHFLAKLLLNCKDPFTMNDYRQLLSHKEIAEWWLPLILQRGMNQFKDSCEPFVRYGIFQFHIKNYLKAKHFLPKGEGCHLPEDLTSVWPLCNAYTLYETGETETALSRFQQLMKSDNAFIQQAAKYFTAKILLNGNKAPEAKKLLEEITASEKQTKYGVLSRYKLAAIK